MATFFDFNFAAGTYALNGVSKTVGDVVSGITPATDIVPGEGLKAVGDGVGVVLQAEFTAATIAALPDMSAGVTIIITYADIYAAATYFCFFIANVGGDSFNAELDDSSGTGGWRVVNTSAFPAATGDTTPGSAGAKVAATLGSPDLGVSLDGAAAVTAANDPIVGAVDNGYIGLSAEAVGDIATIARVQCITAVATSALPALSEPPASGDVYGTYSVRSFIQRRRFL